MHRNNAAVCAHVTSLMCFSLSSVLMRGPHTLQNSSSIYFHRRERTHLRGWSPPRHKPADSDEAVSARNGRSLREFSGATRSSCAPQLLTAVVEAALAKVLSADTVAHYDMPSPAESASIPITKKILTDPESKHISGKHRKGQGAQKKIN